MKCVICGQAEYRWVKGKRYVFCPACGIQVPNIDGKIKVLGRPTKVVEEGQGVEKKPDL
jgi:hypothetical protein